MTPAEAYGGNNAWNYLSGRFDCCGFGYPFVFWPALIAV